MAKSDLQIQVECEVEFDKAFRHCLHLCRELLNDAPAQFGGRVVSNGVSSLTLDAVLRPWVRQCYKTIGSTLFRVLRIMQAGDFREGHVNFYLWPGYHSCFNGKRIFFRPEGPADPLVRPQEFGLGFWGDPIVDEPETFHACCQANWYARATVHAADGFWPPSPYYWIMKQEPLSPGKTDVPLESMTYTTDQGAAEVLAPQHYVTLLSKGPGDSRNWGSDVAAFLNSLKRNEPGWQFPDRLDRNGHPGFSAALEPELRELRCLLISLWMHSAFCDGPPDWWDDLIKAARVHNFHLLENRLRAGVSSLSESDWGDQSTGRTQFSTLTTIVLDPMVAPPPDLGIGPRTQSPSSSLDSKEYARHIGWASILCSVPLRLPFIMVARRWLGMVYALMRHSEMSIALKELGVLAKAALAADSLLHDLHRFIELSRTKIIREAEDCSEEAADFRYFAMDAIHAFSSLVYEVYGAAPHPHKLDNARKKFLACLSLPADDLKAILTRVAWDVQHYGSRAGHGRVTIRSPLRTSDINQLEGGRLAYAAGLLLAGEMIRNHVQHGLEGDEAIWSAEVEERQLSITLIASSDFEPRSHTYSLLHTFLEVLGVGSASTKWNPDSKKCTWRVGVNLKGEAAKQ
jgi:hypothetical protein